MSRTTLIAVVVVLCGALVALFFLPAHSKDEQEGEATALTQEGVATTMEIQKQEEQTIQ
jgi:Tfp pilus assembly protein PilN